MKNKMQDVRDHLVAMLEALGDNTANAETIERAKATSMVANSYIGAVRVELDAIKLFDETGKLSNAVVLTEQPKRLQAVP